MAIEQIEMEHSFLIDCYNDDNDWKLKVRINTEEIELREDVYSREHSSDNQYLKLTHQNMEDLITIFNKFKSYS